MLLKLNIFVKKIINIIVPFKILRRNFRKLIDEITIPLVMKKFFIKMEKKYPNSWMFVPFWPWGDFIMCCALLKEFKKENGGEIVIFYTNQQQLEMLKNFNFADKFEKIYPEIYYALCHQSLYLKKHNQWGLQKGKIYEMSHIVFDEAENNRSSNFFEVYSKMLKIKNPMLEEPHIAEDIKKVVNIKFKAASEGKRVIMITPDSNSYDKEEISTDFWLTLAYELEQLGYKIVFNSKEKAYSAFEKIYLPLIEEIYFSSLCYANISIRSGYTDLITVFGAGNQVILYPTSGRFITISEESQLKEMHKCFFYDDSKSLADNMFGFTSINKMYNKTFPEFSVIDEKETIAMIKKIF